MRKDIQALRGIAVLLVVIYHARLGIFGRGFLGVDVFFVVSGFLITGMISRELDTGRFSFGKFYWRRAKRLLPAAYVVFIATSVAAVLLLTRVALRDFRAQAFGAVTFSANWFLYKQAWYFGGDADLKPLLHTWSLSIEEQFYLLFPAFLWLTPARLRKVLVATLFLGSFVFCLYLGASNLSEAFYALPSRSWELMLGAVGALWLRPQAPHGGRTVAPVAGLTGLAAILVFSSVAVDTQHPRLDALCVCVATLTVIWAQLSLLQRGPVSRVLAAVGDRSYSLYLVHWPLFAFANHVYIDNVPLAVRLGIVVVSFLLAAMLYWGVEHPIHVSNIRPSLRWILLAGVTPLLIVGLPHVALRAPSSGRNWIQTTLPNQGLAAQCDSEGTFAPNASCETSTHPRVLVWGDSIAMQIVPGLSVADSSMGIRQATKSACGPIAGIAPETYGPEWARSCLAFNDSVLDHIEHNPSLEYVVLSSQFKQYLRDLRAARQLRMRTTDGVVSGGPDSALRAFVRTIEQLRRYGKKVVIVAPAPSTGVNYALCVERSQTGLPMAGSMARTGCDMPEAEYAAKSAAVIAFLQKVSTVANVSVLWPSDSLCDGRRCRTSEGGVPLYRDEEHLSRDGSILFARESGLFDKAISSAR